MSAVRHGFTLIELLVVISIIALLIGILLPVLSVARRSARQVQNSTQLRGVHNGMVLYAQGNKTYFPGLDSDGKHILIGGATPDFAPSSNFRRLLEARYFTGAYALAPVEINKQAWTSGTVTTHNFSYSMLCLATFPNADEVVEWRDTVNGEAIVLTDRPISPDGASPTGVQSVWTHTTDDQTWRGGVVWNDNHVTFEPRERKFTTQYGDDPVNDANDNLFQNVVGRADAFMVYEGIGPGLADVFATD